jgi:adenylyltransferase/sulfurtransferase
MNAHVLVVGAGGNIGSHLVPHLARMTEISRVTLIDRDAYEEANLSTQDITPRDIGSRKALVQAARLRRINPALRVSAVPAAVEALPLGALRADVIVTCLDSRIARQCVNASARHLGVPLIDGGVDAGQLLARVNVYLPGHGAPCLECAWDEHDYAALEQLYPCAGQAPSPTNAPSSLGAFTAALAAMECRKVLAAEAADDPARQALFDLAHQRLLVTTFRRNPACRLTDHEPWQISPLPVRPGDLTVAGALDLADAGVALGIAGARLTTRRTCVSCGHSAAGLRITRPRFTAHDPCPRCGGWFVSAGAHVLEELTREMARGGVGRRSLGSLGVRTRDVLTVRSDRGLSRFEITGDPA